jgi:hypothetical protein
MLFFHFNPPPTNYLLTLIKPFSIVWYIIPLLKTGAFNSTRDLFLWVDDEKTCKKPAYVCPMASIGHNTCLIAAFSGFYQSPGPPLPGNAQDIVPAHHHGHQNGQQSWSIFCCPFVCCWPGGNWGNTEQVVAWWRHPVASGVALDMLYRAMPSVSLRRTTMAIKTTNNGGTFWCHRWFPLWQ